MEPLAALGVAAAVIQFVDFGSRLLTSTWETYRDTSGQGHGLRDFQVVSDDLHQRISPIRQSLKAFELKATAGLKSQEAAELEAALLSKCSDCDEIAGQLEKVLPKTIRSLNSMAQPGLLPKNGSVRPSNGDRFVMALEQYWNRDKILEFEKRLHTVRNQTTEIMITLTWYDSILMLRVLSLPRRHSNQGTRTG